MSGGEDEDDKPTVVLDLNALKRQKLKAEEDLANLVSELEFNVGQDASAPSKTVKSEEIDSEKFAERFLDQRKKVEVKKLMSSTFPIVLFDYESQFFQTSLPQFPTGFDYKVVSDLATLNKFLQSKNFLIVVFNYDMNPKVVNTLSAQIKKKFPHAKTLIVARLISPQKAQVHAKSASGASGYYQLPLDAKKMEQEFLRIQSQIKKVS